MSMKKVVQELDIKLTSMNDYLRTLATRHAESLTHGQSVLMLDIFMRYAKYKIYGFIMDKLQDERNDSEKGNLTAAVRVQVDGTIVEIRNKLGLFKCEGRHLSEYVPSDNDCVPLINALEKILSKKTGGIAARKKSQRYEVKELLNAFFDVKLI